MASKSKKYYFKKGDFNITIELKLDETMTGMPAFSASGIIQQYGEWQRCGQCLDRIKEILKDDNKTFNTIYLMWQKHHLNNMHVGTEEQEQALKDNNMSNALYEKCREYLESINMLEVMYDNKPYKYGHGWVYKEIPKNDLETIQALLK